MKPMLPILLVCITLAAIVATAEAGNGNNLKSHATTVAFFQKHKWLMAPNKENCTKVPWVQSCKIARKVYKRELKHVIRIKHAMWMDYHYNWRSWLPANWVGVATCETHMDFSFANSSFVSAFGISRSIYDSDAAYMGAPPWNDAHPPTPRQQYLAALGHYAQYGDGWGCPGP